MLAIPTSTALVPYDPPLTPMEFVKSEVERALFSGSLSLEQTPPNPPSGGIELQK